ncbi:putative secreted protein [Propionispora sp. 2/2-37]|uniref:hypothetical protein n=1 Tax=Propionispora sp. 2/2-37 TaxID=1677858 RepID=UPI0006BB9721|nr:hypothetical protein [Propionispora sp. 2/2-37]CUH96891.1 putative secreted protein [Propionispora sp. 2/2-37]
MRNTRKNKFGTLFCLAVLVVLSAMFSLALPGLLLSDAGKIFSGLWGTLVAIMIAAHVRTLWNSRQKRYYLYPSLLNPAGGRQNKNIRLSRLMRG